MKRSNLHTYLAPYLASGNDAEIAAARKRYARMYQAAWVKSKRKGQRSFLIYLSDVEVQVIASAARSHRRSKTRFIKEAALAYTRQLFLVPDVVAVYEIKGLLEANRAALSSLLDQALLPYAVADMLASILVELEMQIRKSLEQPKRFRDDH